MGFRVT